MSCGNLKDQVVVFLLMILSPRLLGGVAFALDPKKTITQYVHDVWTTDYTALSFLDPKKVRFKYKLEGYDEEWVDAGTRRVVYYTSLSPGSYRFRVIACNNDGVWNETGTELELNLRPHFYETRWFYALCVVLTAIALILAG